MKLTINVWGYWNSLKLYHNKNDKYRGMQKVMSCQYKPTISSLATLISIEVNAATALEFDWTPLAILEEVKLALSCCITGYTKALVTITTINKKAIEYAAGIKIPELPLDIQLFYGAMWHNLKWLHCHLKSKMEARLSATDVWVCGRTHWSNRSFKPCAAIQNQIGKNYETPV